LMVLNKKKERKKCRKENNFVLKKRVFGVLVFTRSNFPFLAHIFCLEDRLCAFPLAVDRVKESVFVPPSAIQTFAWQIESLVVALERICVPSSHHIFKKFFLRCRS